MRHKWPQLCAVYLAALWPTRLRRKMLDAREQLLTGADEIALTLQRKPEIAAYQERECAAHPWVYLPQRQDC